MTPKILIVEDDHFLIKAMSYKLKQAGFDIQLCEDGSCVIKKAREFLPNLILLDLVMPNQDGFETLKILKSDLVLSQIPVIVTSNLSQDSDIKQAKKLGAAHYLIKSDTSLQSIIDTVSTYLSKPLI